MARGKGKKKGASKKQKPRKRSNFQKWLRYMLKTYGVFSIKDNRENFQMLVVYASQGTVPPTMPRPLGPSPGAQLTLRQFCNDFVIATGVTTGNITQTGSTAEFGAIAFSLQDLPQVATLAALFDQYKIERVHLRIRPYNESISVLANAAANLASPSIYIVVDRDDNNVAGSINALTEYDNVQKIEGSMSCDVILKPSITPSIFASGAFSGYAVTEQETWLDVANTAIPYYGVKFGVTALDISATYTWQWFCEAWYEVSFRNIR